MPEVSDPQNQPEVQKGHAGEMLKIAVPVSVEAIFQMSFNFVDQIIVGFLGATAVAAVGLSNSVATVGMLLYAAIGVGCGVLIAQAYGRKDMEEVSRITSTSVMLAAIFALLTGTFLNLFASQILHLVGADDRLSNEAIGYFKLYGWSIVPMIVSAVASAVFRSLDDSRTPMWVSAIAVVLNTALGYLFVFGAGPIPKLGVAGAGTAILVTQIFRAATLLFLLYHNKEGAHWTWPVPSRAVNTTAARLIKITVPIAAAEVLWGTSSFVYTIIFVRLGTAAMAASQMTNSLETIFVVASSGLGPAAVALIGHALGKKSVDIANANARLALRLGILASLLFGTALAATAFLLPFLFPKVGKDVLGLAFWGVLIVALIQPAKVLNSILGNGVLASGGDTGFVLVGNLSGTYGAGLPLAWVLGLALKFGFFGVYAAKSAEELIKLTCFYLRFRTPQWYRRSMDEFAKENEAASQLSV